MKKSMLVIVCALLITVAVAVPSLILALITQVVDDTPPYIYYDDYTGVDVCVPANNQKYSGLNLEIIAAVYDPESGVKNVNVTIKSSTWTWTKNLLLNTGDGWSCIYWGYWVLSSPYSYSTSTVTLPSYGTYEVFYYMENYAGLKSTYHGTFEVAFPMLRGIWYIGCIVTDNTGSWWNWKEITSANQTVYLTSSTVYYRFCQTQGVADVTCTVTWVGLTEGTSSGTKTMTLTSNPSLWETSIAFPNGRYNVELKATDGTNVILLNIMGFKVDVNLPQVSWDILLSVGIAVSALLIVAVYFFAKKKKK